MNHDEGCLEENSLIYLELRLCKGIDRSCQCQGNRAM